MYYRDRANNFEVGIPNGWRYFTAKNKTDLPLRVLRPVMPGADVKDKSFENFNLNIIDQPNENTASSYKKLVSALSGTKNFKLIEEGNITSPTESFKWLKEIHKNDLMGDQDIENYVFLTWKNGKTYILTFVTIPASFKKFEPIFLQIAKTFSVSFDKRENLVVSWPGEYKFTVTANIEDSMMHTVQLLPANETVNNWTIVVSVTTIKNVRVTNMDAIIKSYTDAAIKESNAAKYEILEEKNTPGQMYALLKVETPFYPNDPNPESQLYYFAAGEKTSFTCMVAVKKARLPAEFIDKWSSVFKSSKLVRE